MQKKTQQEKQLEHLSKISFREDSRDYRTEIPNIVHELLKAKKITAQDATLYWTYRRIAGENGACWVGTRGLAEQTGFSVKTITKCKKNLSKKFDMLKGKSLIEIIPCDRKSEIADTVVIENIWPENFEYFKKSLTCSKSDHTGVVNQTTRVWEIRPHKNQPKKKEPKEERTFKESSSSIESLPGKTKNDDDDDFKKPLSMNKHLDSEAVTVTKTNGTKISMSQSDIYRHFVKFPQYTTEMIQEAISRIRQVNGPVNNILKYLESVCESILKEQQSKKIEKPSKKESKQITSSWGPTENKPTVRMGDVLKKENIEFTEAIKKRVNWDSLEIKEDCVVCNKCKKEISLELFPTIFNNKLADLWKDRKELRDKTEKNE